MMNKVLEATQFLAILAVCFLGSLAMFKITDSVNSKEIVILAMTSIGSLAGGSALGYAAGKKTTKKEDKDKIKV